MTTHAEQVEKWLGKLTRLNPASGRGQCRGKAPHKPLLLLCLVDVAEAGELMGRTFTRTANLVLRFMECGAFVSERWPTRLDLKRAVQLPFLFVLLWAVVVGCRPSVEGDARKVANLIDPAKLATLGDRRANPRVRKYVALLAEAEGRGLRARSVAERATAIAGMDSGAAELTVRQMVQNLKIARELGCLDADGLREMRRGKAPIVRSGPYRGDELSVDHIIPLQVVPELDNVIANLEFLPLRMNERKNARIGERQIDLARDLHKAGILSAKGLEAVESHAK